MSETYPGSEQIPASDAHNDRPEEDIREGLNAALTGIVELPPYETEHFLNAFARVEEELCQGRSPEAQQIFRKFFEELRATLIALGKRDATIH